MSFPARFEPIPITAAPASSHSSAFNGEHPPDGIMFMAASGDTPRIDFKIFGPTKPAWNILSIIAPCRFISHSSFEV